MSRKPHLSRPPGLRPSMGERSDPPTDLAQRLVEGPIDFDEAAIRQGQSLPQMQELLRSGELPPGWGLNRGVASITAIPAPLRRTGGAGGGASSSRMAAATAR